MVNCNVFRPTSVCNGGCLRTHQTSGLTKPGAADLSRCRVAQIVGRPWEPAAVPCPTIGEPSYPALTAAWWVGESTGLHWGCLCSDTVRVHSTGTPLQQSRTGLRSRSDGDHATWNLTKYNTSQDKSNTMKRLLTFAGVIGARAGVQLTGRTAGDQRQLLDLPSFGRIVYG